jgi:hypothetical protein
MQNTLKAYAGIRRTLLGFNKMNLLKKDNIKVKKSCRLQVHRKVEEERKLLRELMTQSLLLSMLCQPAEHLPFFFRFPILSRISLAVSGRSRPPLLLLLLLLVLLVGLGVLRGEPLDRLLGA